MSVAGQGRGTPRVVNHRTDWGVTVSGAAARNSLATAAMWLLSFSLLTAASLFMLPILAWIYFSGLLEGTLPGAAAVACCLLLALFMGRQARNGPRNALQIDYSAGEVRLGTRRADGAFARQRVCGFRQIARVYIDRSVPSAPSLCLELPGEIATIPFFRGDGAELEETAAMISAAVESARRAPVRSRVQSRILGVEASLREVGQRVRSRVHTRFA